MRPPAPTDQIATLLDRSEVFEAAVVECFPAGEPLLATATLLHQLVATSCLPSVEHASAPRAAFEGEAPNSASALLRLQGEALLRAAWLLFAVPPAQFEKLARPLDPEAETAANNKDGYRAMLAAVTVPSLLRIG